MATIISSCVVSASGLRVTVVWETGGTFGSLSIQPNKTAYVLVKGAAYRLTAKVSQVDNGGEGANATVEFLVSSAVPYGIVASFWADAGFMADAFTNSTPESAGDDCENNSAVRSQPGPRLRARDFRRWKVAS